MEQLFTLVNDLLKRDEGGRRRKLHIRTYKIVPLQRRNGLIEFAANTAPLGSCLSRLYEYVHLFLLFSFPLFLELTILCPRRQMAPGKAQEARKKLGEVERANRGRPEDRDRDKRKVFSKIMQTFPPLLRHLFWQKHKVPSLWFDMRLNYSRSVAVNSVTGHIAGLGDRHVSNILIDEAKGELVHIDFGIAFEGVRCYLFPCFLSPLTFPSFFVFPRRDVDFPFPNSSPSASPTISLMASE
jgi:ataxia telangiectasia mutated family protein